MDNIKLILQVLSAVLGILAALLSIPLFLRFRWPAAAMWGLKIFVSALSPVLILIGMFAAIVGLIIHSLFISLIGILVALTDTIHIISVTRPPNASTNFKQAFGLNWKIKFSPEQKAHFLPTRFTFLLPAVSTPRLERNIPFATIPGTDRKLLCDVWQPPKGVSPTGVAFIYLHGSAWYFLDKDIGTRPLFRHLAAQGHVVMDVAYRLAPETDLMGMVHDVKRAIAWMKKHADSYGVNPTRIVVGGGSAGGHLALMAAYTSGNPQFTPSELGGKDVSVCAVISLYSPADLVAMYYHTNQHLTTRSIPGKPKKAVPTKMPEWVVKAMGENYHRLGFDKNFENAGAFAPLLGGHPDECPDKYRLFSPIMYVHPGCPPTLLIHGEQDIMAPVTTTRNLHTRLLEEHIPAVMHILPQADHAFDLIIPKIALAAHNAIYDIERFLALMAVRKQIVVNRTTVTNNSITTNEAK